MRKAGDVHLELEVDVYPGKYIVYVAITDGNRSLQGDIVFERLEELWERVKKAKKAADIIKIGEEFDLIIRPH